jgi:hypothetical protein
MLVIAEPDDYIDEMLSALRAQTISSIRETDFTMDLGFKSLWTVANPHRNLVE